MAAKCDSIQPNIRAVSRSVKMQLRLPAPWERPENPIHENTKPLEALHGPLHPICAEYKQIRTPAQRLA